MTTTPVVKGRAVSAATKAAEASAVPDAQTKGINRREFLNYIWGASMALLLAESAGAIVWFALPRFRAGEFGGAFALDPASLPQKATAPIGFAPGKFWISNTNDGLLALSMVCTHLGCLFKWVPSNNRFECPCHGSKFEANGKKIIGEGPAQRNLDRFVITVTTSGGPVKTDADGEAVKVDGATAISVDTGKKILGKPASAA
ncbi:MAG: Rieske 2Fe-2S domain-containing protein [Chloroflexota bacterium]